MDWYDLAEDEREEFGNGELLVMKWLRVTEDKVITSEEGGGYKEGRLSRRKTRR